MCIRDSTLPWDQKRIFAAWFASASKPRLKKSSKPSSAIGLIPVSYTHLDVYKRQVYRGGAKYELDMFTVYNRELTIKSAVLSPGLFDRSVRILNRINFAETITAEYTLDQYEEAFAAHKSGKNMKIVLKIDPESPDC